MYACTSIHLVWPIYNYKGFYNIEVKCVAGHLHDNCDRFCMTNKLVLNSFDHRYIDGTHDVDRFQANMVQLIDWHTPYMTAIASNMVLIDTSPNSLHFPNPID